jgi:chorismate mutase
VRLEDIAGRLQGLEETLIYKLLDRAQFAHNPEVYQKGKSGFSGQGTQHLLWHRLHHQEKLESYFGRYLIPEERPFTAPLPAPGRNPLGWDHPLPLQDLEKVNVTADLLSAYLPFVARICVPGDDRQHGSSVEHDVMALQAISARVHYGAFYVAESKYLGQPKEYRNLIKNKDETGLMKLLTRPEVEEKILQRVQDKVEKIQGATSPLNRHLVDAGSIREFFAQSVIPLTKKGEIFYLLNRPV